jgi:hypothetical protein
MKTVTAIFLTWVVCMAIGASNAYAWGTTYQTYGNLTYGSDGSRYQTYGNTTYATYPNQVSNGGINANIILDGARNQPNYANTILQGQAIAAQREQENRIAEQEARIQELQMQENIRKTSQLKQEAAYIQSVANYQDKLCASLAGNENAFARVFAGCKK